MAVWLMYPPLVHEAHFLPIFSFSEKVFQLSVLGSYGRVATNQKSFQLSVQGLMENDDGREASSCLIDKFNSPMTHFCFLKIHFIIKVIHFA